MDNSSSLSLFENDPLRGVLTKMHLARDGKLRYSILLPAIVIVSWFVPFLLAAFQNNLLGPVKGLGFLHDPNLPTQTLVILLFFLAEPLTDERVRNAGRKFTRFMILPETCAYDCLVGKVARLRQSRYPDLILIALSCCIVLAWVLPSLHKAVPRWDIDVTNGHTSLTVAGCWFVFVFGPLFPYVWLRWLWKFLIWIYFLYGIARYKLRISVAHPDKCGGLSFLGEVQSGFGILIFAMGIVIAASMFHEVSQEHITTGILVASSLTFVVVSSIVFMSPLLMFSKQLYAAKQEGLMLYGILLSQAVTLFENTHLSDKAGIAKTSVPVSDLTSLASLESLHEHVAHMRIIPYDLRALTHLLAYGITPIMPLLLKYIPWSFAHLLFDRVFKK